MIQSQEKGQDQDRRNPIKMILRNTALSLWSFDFAMSLTLSRRRSLASRTAIDPVGGPGQRGEATKKNALCRLDPIHTVWHHVPHTDNHPLSKESPVKKKKKKNMLPRVGGVGE